MRPSMRAVIFDCDGVLVDSELLSCGAWLPVLTRYRVPAELSEVERFVGRSDRAVLEYFRDKTGLPLKDDLIAEREQQYFELARGRLESFLGLPEVLSQLKKEGTTLAVASSGRHDKIRFNLTEVGLDSFFEVICSVIEVQRGKPAPDLFLLTASKLGVAPEQCAVVEDSVPGIQAARAAEMIALGFTSSHAATVLEEAGAHGVFSGYHEFLALLKSVSPTG